MDEELRVLLKNNYQFSLLEEEKLNTKGSRQAYAINTNIGKVVIKITHGDRSIEQVQKEVELLSNIEKRNLLCPSIIHANDNSLCIPYEDKFVYAYRYIEGNNPKPSDIFS